MANSSLRIKTKRRTRIPKIKTRMDKPNPKHYRRPRLTRIMKNRAVRRQRALPSLLENCGGQRFIFEQPPFWVATMNEVDKRYDINIIDQTRIHGEPIRIFSSFIFEPAQGWTPANKVKYYVNALENYMKMLEIHKDRYLMIGFYISPQSHVTEIYQRLMNHPRILIYHLNLGNCASFYNISFESTIFRYWPMTCRYHLNGQRTNAVVYIRDAHMTLSMNGLEDEVLSHFESTGAKIHLYNSPNYYPPHSMISNDIVTSWPDTGQVNDPRQIKRVLAGLIGVRVGDTDDQLNIDLFGFWDYVSHYKQPEIRYGIDEWFFTEVYYNPIARKTLFNGDATEHVSPLLWFLYIISPPLDVFKTLKNQLLDRTLDANGNIQASKQMINSNRMYTLYADAHHALHVLATHYEMSTKIRLPDIVIGPFLDYVEQVSKKPTDPLFNYARLIPLRSQIWDFVYNTGSDIRNQTLASFFTSWTGNQDAYSMFSSSARDLYGNGMEGKTSFESFQYPLSSPMHVRYGIQFQDLRRINLNNLGSSAADFNVYLKRGRQDTLINEFVNGRTARDLMMRYRVSPTIEIANYQGLFIENSQPSLVCAMTNYIPAGEISTSPPSWVSSYLMTAVVPALLDFYINALAKKIHFYHLDLHKDNVIITSTNPLKVVIIDTEHSRVFYNGANSVTFNDKAEIIKYPYPYVRLNNILAGYQRNYESIKNDASKGIYRMVDLIDVFSFYISSITDRGLREVVAQNVEQYLLVTQKPYEYRILGDLKKECIRFLYSQTASYPMIGG